LTAVWRLPLALGLAVIAIGLLGYAVYTVQAKQSEVESLRDEVSELREEAELKEARIYNTLLSEAALNVLDRMVEEPDEEARRALIWEIAQLVFNDLVTYGAGEEIWGRIDQLVETTDQAERQDIRDRLEQKIADMSPIPLDRANLSLDEARSFSTLVTAVLALGSGLGSFFIFITSGGRRKIEDEMLSLDLEKSRIELVKLRFEARDALEHEQMP